MTINRPPIIGLTGGIGAGKSTVASILRELGCVVVDSDALARQALCDPHIKGTIIEWWGKGMLDAEGEINRKAVADIVFADAAQRRRLEQLTHPWIEARRKAIFDNAPPSTPALVIDAPLLVEAGLDAQCDAVVFVDAPPEVRQQRIEATRGWNAAELAKREDSQLPLDAKRRRADHVVTNQGDLTDLAAQVGRVLRQVTAVPRP
jgi:dephospho-CoA kinase